MSVGMSIPRHIGPNIRRYSGHIGAASVQAGPRDLESEIEERCRTVGLKMTGQRRTIARVLAQGGDHPNVEELYRQASAIDKKISIATVYRTVRLFEEEGILSRLDFGNGPARYEPADRSAHYHLIDVETGKVLEFEDRVLEAQLEAIADRLGYKIVSKRLELFGQAASTGAGKPGAKPKPRLLR